MAGGDSTVISRIDGVMTSVAVKAPVAAVAIVPIQLKGLQTVNGVVLTATIPPTRCLVVAQADATTNGIYDVSTTSWQRSTDFDGAYDAVQGTLVLVVGAGFSPAVWQLTTANPVVFGTSAINFVSIGAAFPGLSNGIVALSNPIFAGNFTAAAASAAATAAAILIDRAGFVTSDTTVLPAVTNIIGIGAGAVVLGAHNITFSSNTLTADAVHLFDISGGGHLLGTVLCDAYYPEWTGAISGASAGTNAATTRAAIQELEAFDSQSSRPCRELRFTGYSYAVDVPVTNPVAGTALRWIGQGWNNTLMYSMSNTQIRILTGVSAGSATGVFCKGMTFNGISAGGATTNLEIRDWCGFEHEDMCYDRAASGYLLRSYAGGGFSENLRGRRNVFGPLLTSLAIELKTDAGTGSLRGHSETEFQFSRTQSVTALSFIVVRAQSIVYNGDLSGSFTNHTNEAATLVVCQGSFGCYWKKTAFDLETSSTGTIQLGSTNVVALGGGYQAISNFAIKNGTAVFGASVILDGATVNIIQGWARIDRQIATGNGTPFTLAEPNLFGGTRKVRFELQDGFTFFGVVECTVWIDPIGSATSIQVNYVHTFYNTLGITFDTTKISVMTNGQITYTANFGSESVIVTGIAQYSGSYQ